MKKLLPVLFITLALSACGERESTTKIRQICEEDIKKEGTKFDCDCQMDIFKNSLSDEQMDLLAKFIETERRSPQEAMAISKEPGFDELYKKLVEKAADIEKNCRK